MSEHPPFNERLLTHGIVGLVRPEIREYTQADLEDSREGRSDIKRKTNLRFMRWMLYLWTEPRLPLRRDQER